MEILSDGISINVICESEIIPSNKTPIIFLHGFTGSAKDWIFIFNKLSDKYFPMAIDLPGHGKTLVPDNLEFYSTEAYKNIISQVLQKFKIEKAIFVGYSMGGRTALSFAVDNPQKVKALILESATAGIEKETEKISRIKTDSDIANNILENGINQFVNYWMELPFFQSLKSLNAKTYQKIIENKKKNSIVGLANSLKGFSTGLMPSLWNKISRINFPTLLIVGELDRKYVRLNKEMTKKIKTSEMIVFSQCGHNTHLENPEDFTILTNKFLNNLENNET